jgi:hypothetical protein
MRKALLSLILITICFASTSQALFLGQLRSAETSGWGSLNLMTSVGIFEDASVLVGSVRYGIAPPLDGAFSIAILDHEASEDATLIIGGDLQYRFSHADLGSPLDMAIGVMIEYYSLDAGQGHNSSNLGVGFNYVASKSIKLENGFNFTPYGRLNVRIDHQHPGDATGGDFQEWRLDRHDSKLNIGVNLGSVVPLSNKVNLVGELQLDDQIGFIAGLNFFMW